MRIVMIGQKGAPAHSGGVERHVEDLSVRLAAQGMDVVVYARTSYASDPSCPRVYRGVKLAYLPTLRSKHFETVIHVFFSTLHALLDPRVTVMHYHGIGPALFCWLPRLLRPRVRVIATFHCQDYYHQKWGVLARFAFRLGERAACTLSHETIAVSQTIREYILTRYGREATYIPNAVPVLSGKEPRIIESFGLAKGNYILCVARLVRHKGVHTVIASYRQAIQCGGAGFPYLVIVGANAYTERYEKELKAAASSCPSILFLGEQTGDALAELYSNARLFIQASESEGLSYTLLEAMSYGCPLLVSDIPEHRELIKDEQLFFKNKSADDLSKKVIAFFREPKPLERAALAYRERVRVRYNIDRTFANVLSVYTSLAA